MDKAKLLFKEFNKLEYVRFDFENPETFEKAIDNVDRVFLLRPPQIADVDRYIKPLVLKMREKQVNEIVFLSVQGAEKSKVIPHNKIERLVKESGLSYIFLRPSYFMQNLTTTLLNDIKIKGKIILPAGKAKFNWIDIRNIGEAAAILLNQFTEHLNQTIEITGYENANFYTAAKLISTSINKRITYQSLNPIAFYRLKKSEGVATGFIIVVIMLHFIPRLQKEPKISQSFEQLTGRKPNTLAEFIEREKQLFG